ncbi:MAG: OFA family MFS transporter [Thermoguttaceae bacterium]|nr:OFA family MFS transporter [Thermoguttaceae bacterium]MDW8037620.1 OFA family MFS transporter [Thermoguttaceae bacterium]
MNSTDSLQGPSVGLNRGWIVTLAGLGINLALGSIYSWSVIRKAIPDDWAWSDKEKALPYSVALLLFSFMMVPAGRLQDRIGPRWVATFGGLLLGLGLVLCSLSTQSWAYVVGFGLLGGSGIGFAYACCTPAAVKWFPAAKTGMIAGIVVSGFGLAAVYSAPLIRWLIGQAGVQQTLLILGIAFSLVVVFLAQLLQTPPPGYAPGRSMTSAGKSISPATASGPAQRDYSPSEILKTWQFYLLWLMYAVGAGAGLMVISNLADFAKKELQLELGHVLVAALALGNGIGRIITGSLSDLIGRRATLLLCFVLQMCLMLLLAQASPGGFLSDGLIMAAASALVGANFGANLALFPAVTKDYYGLKHFGANYGMMFTAYGVGGFGLSLLAGWLYDLFKTYTYSCYVAAGLLLLAVLLTLVVRPPKTTSQAA